MPSPEPSTQRLRPLKTGSDCAQTSWNGGQFIFDTCTKVVGEGLYVDDVYVSTSNVDGFPQYDNCQAKAHIWTQGDQISMDSGWLNCDYWAQDGSTGFGIDANVNSGLLCSILIFNIGSPSTSNPACVDVHS